VTEDEAFIRAIVDSPGDDTPRLVYADWLDDCDDPRGPYLRAEYEAAQTGDILRLWELARRLDSVWVARLSRPPVGVCCDRVRFSNRGDAVTAADIDRFVARHTVFLGSDYRAFVLNYNGGTPDPGRAGAVVVERFYRLGGQRRSNEWVDLSSVYLQHRTDYLGRHYRQEDNPWHWNYFPIATLAQGGHQLCLGIGTCSTGYLYSLTNSTNYDPNNATRLALTFTELLLSLNGGPAARANSTQAEK